MGNTEIKRISKPEQPFDVAMRYMKKSCTMYLRHLQNQLEASLFTLPSCVCNGDQWIKPD